MVRKTRISPLARVAPTARAGRSEGWLAADFHVGRAGSRHRYFSAEGTQRGTTRCVVCVIPGISQRASREAPLPRVCVICVDVQVVGECKCGGLVAVWAPGLIAMGSRTSASSSAGQHGAASSPADRNAAAAEGTGGGHRPCPPAAPPACTLRFRIQCS